MKYHSKKTVIDGLTFDSRKEAQRWGELCIMQKCGLIENLQRQVRFALLPAQKGKTRRERPVSYVADFVYTMNGETVVEDTKGMKTRDYVIKRKLMLYIHGVEVREI